MIVWTHDTGYCSVRTAGYYHAKLVPEQVLGYLATSAARTVRYIVPGERPKIVPIGEFERFWAATKVDWAWLDMLSSHGKSVVPAPARRLSC